MIKKPLLLLPSRLTIFPIKTHPTTRRQKIGQCLLPQFKWAANRSVPSLVVKALQDYNLSEDSWAPKLSRRIANAGNLQLKIFLKNSK
jgi:hypothetical protein